MNRIYYFIFLSIFLFKSAHAQFSANIHADQNVTRKNPVSFSRVPFLLLKVTPTAALGRDNVFQYGIEIAPPFGKFSFGFDYGIGKGSWSLNKEQKDQHPEQETRIMRAEIRGYFSDWYPFYAMDKKPFGRYYALEYVQKDLTYDESPLIELYGNTTVPSLQKVKVAYVERALHLKMGNHFIISRWFFIDAYAGLGVGYYSSNPVNYELDQKKNAFLWWGKPEREISSTGFFLSKTAGIRFCIPI